MKIAIVITYFNRPQQLSGTLQSIRRTTHSNYKIFIVDDNSTLPAEGDATIIRIGDIKSWVNPVIPYNIGIIEALKSNPDIIILQNAECYHYGDIVSYAAAHVRSDNYIAFCTLSIDESLTNQGVNDDMIGSLLPVPFSVPNNPESRDLGWYHHPQYNPRPLDFCVAIKADNLKKINGYDERFANHIWYGDNDLLRRVQNLGLQIESPDYPFVVHQWHDHAHITAENSVDNGVNLFNEITEKEKGNYRAVHTYTPDL